MPEMITPLKTSILAWLPLLCGCAVGQLESVATRTDPPLPTALGTVSAHSQADAIAPTQDSSQPVVTASADLTFENDPNQNQTPIIKTGSSDGSAQFTLVDTGSVGVVTAVVDETTPESASRTAPIVGIGQTPSAIPNSTSMSLQDFESLASVNNPAIRELAATTQKAVGFRTQVNLRPNPTVGYQAQQLADRGTDQHLIFAEQEFVTGGKLQLNRRVMNEAVRAQSFELEAQKYRVLTDIRSTFYAALATQKQIDLIHEFRSVSDKGYELALLRKKAAEGSQIDVLQAKIQKSEIDLSLQQAEVRFLGYFRELAALAGTADLPLTRLQGDLSVDAAAIDWTAWATQVVGASPEYSAAQSRIAQAQAALARHNVQAVPNLAVQLGAGVDNGTESGMINLQVGAPIPVFNKNQGNIEAARAELCRAMMEAARIENAIKARLATASREYDSASAAVTQYQSQILPSANEALQLAEEAYRAGETSFLQVLEARRTFFDSNLEYVTAQSELAIAQANLNGYLLSGALDPVYDGSGDDSLRGLTFSQQ